MADPPGPAERDRHPDGVARHRRARRTSLEPAAHRPVPEHQPARHHDRHHLHRRRRPGHREDRHLPDREGGQRGHRRPATSSREPRQGISTVRVWFNYGADLEQRPDRGHPAHPADHQHAARPASSSRSSCKFDLSNIPVCLVTVSGGGLDERQLYDLAYNTIEPQLERLAGVASADVDGGKVRQITVNLNRDLLYAKGISVLDVVRAVNDSNFLMPAGDIKVGTARLQHLHEQPVPAREAHGGHRRPQGRRTTSPSTSATSATCHDSHETQTSGRPGRRRARRVPAREQAAGREHHRGGRRGQGAAAEAPRRAARA